MTHTHLMRNTQTALALQKTSRPARPQALVVAMPARNCLNLQAREGATGSSSREVRISWYQLFSVYFTRGTPPSRKRNGEKGYRGTSRKMAPGFLQMGRGPKILKPLSGIKSALCKVVDFAGEVLQPQALNPKPPT